MSKELKILVQLKSKFVSVNSLYKSRVTYKAGRPIATVYKNPKAVQVESEIREQLRAVDFSEYLDWLKDTPGFKLQIQFIFKKSVTTSDSSNYIKNLEDILTRFIKDELGVENYDDSKHTEIYAVKSVIPKSKHEYALISLSESKCNLRFDEIEEPERFFLGGTCAETKWREELIPELTKRGYTYFNPVVPDWTPECKEIEDIEKSEKCNTHLYILTPEMKGVYSVAEVINSAWECISGGSGFVYFGILGTQEDWGKAQYKSLQAVLDMVNNIGSGSSRIKAGWIKEPKDVLDL